MTMSLMTTTRLRRAGGPTGGPNVLSRMTLTEPGTNLTARAHLFATVLSANPAYLPGISSGAVPFEAWYRRKDPTWVRVASTPAGDPHLVGHVAVRLNALLPDGRLLESAGLPRLSWELGMLVVRPGFRGCGLAAEMVHTATATFNQPLWSVVHDESPGHRLLTRHGWAEVGTTTWADDPVPGIVLVSRTATT